MVMNIITKEILISKKNIYCNNNIYYLFKYSSILKTSVQVADYFILTKMNVC